MKNFEAILFDFDGVLADSMEDNFRAWEKAFLFYGVEIRKEDYFPLEGMKLEEVAKTISKKYNLNANPKDIVELKNKYYLENHKFRFYPGVLEMIDELKNKKKAIISASPGEKLKRTVPKDFLDKFDVVISGDDTTKGKPNPEPYVKAMKKLNVEVEKCVVIENAPLGIRAAKTAGLYCIALTTTLSKEYLKEADEVVENHEKLIRFLAK